MTSHLPTRTGRTAIVDADQNRLRPVRTFVIAAREDKQIAAEVRARLPSR